MEQRDRFAGADGAARFLEAFGRLTCVPLAPAFAAATPIGPCAMLGGEDTWTDVPFVEGVALIGDAAGYNDPIIGQGLALALRDVRVLSELLLAQSAWTPDRLLPYAEERRERMRRVRFTAKVMTALYCTFGPEGAARRARFFSRVRAGDDPSYPMALAAVHAGPEQIPAWAFEDDLYRKVLA